jgi:hypothetical protein
MCVCLAVRPAAAQEAGASSPTSSSPNLERHPPPSRVGLGIQVGDPSGISLKVYRRSTTRKGILGTVDAYSFLAAWNLDSFFYLNAHALKENALEDSPLNYYIGPGLIAGFRDNSTRGNDFVAGISVEGGVNFFTERFEVFLGLTPWFRVIPDPALYLGGGVGLRFYP